MSPPRHYLHVAKVEVALGHGDLDLLDPGLQDGCACPSAGGTGPLSHRSASVIAWGQQGVRMAADIEIEGQGRLT